MTTAHAQEVGARLRRARGKRSMDEIAARIGVTQATVSRWETGAMTVSPKRYALVAAAYGRSWHKLFEPDPIPAPEPEPAVA